MDDRQHPRMLCFVRKIHYDYRKRRGTVWIRRNGCTDMAGVLYCFLGLDAEVNEIRTLSSGTPDTTYLKTPGGWKAVRPQAAPKKR